MILYYALGCVLLLVFEKQARVSVGCRVPAACEVKREILEGTFRKFS